MFCIIAKFAGNAFNRFEYDDRNQLTDSSRYLGSDVSDLSNPVQPEQRSYEYDPIGNRLSATGWDDAISTSKVDTYTSNSLDQYEYSLDVKRILYIDNVLYTVSEKLVKMNDLESLDPIEQIELS